MKSQFAILLLIFWQFHLFGQWELMNEIDHTGCLEEIEFTTSYTGFIVAGDLIGSTSNSGETWEINTIYTGNFKIVDFINQDTGIICCYPDVGSDIMITYDGGDTWNFPPLNINDFIIDIELNGNGNIISTDGIVATNTYLVEDYYTYYSSFNIISTGLPPYDLEFPSSDTGFICGLLMDVSSFSSVYKTVDGGINWYTTESMYGPKYQLSFVNSQIGYGIGSERRVWKTEDSGESWFMLPFDFGYAITDDNFELGELYFFNSQVGLLETYTYHEDGTITMEIRRTVDGGNIWYETDYPFEDFTGVGTFHCTGEDTCYFVTCDNIYYTTNGGGIETGIAALEESSISISISPNPTKGWISLNCIGAEMILSINTINSFGETVELKFENYSKADTHLLPPGVYFTEINTKGGKVTCTWIKL